MHAWIVPPPKPPSKEADSDAHSSRRRSTSRVGAGAQSAIRIEDAAWRCPASSSAEELQHRGHLPAHEGVARAPLGLGLELLQEPHLAAD